MLRVSDCVRVNATLQFVCARERKREREREHVCVRERECVCVQVHAKMLR